jgi:hypothetical protein
MVVDDFQGNGLIYVYKQKLENIFITCPQLVSLDKNIEFDSHIRYSHNQLHMWHLTLLFQN